MHRRSIQAIFCFMCGLILIAQIANAAQIQLQLKLYAIDTDDTTALGPEIIANGTSSTDYLLPNGTQFKVGLLAQVNNPDLTDTFRAGISLDNKPLGIKILTVFIKGLGTPSSGVAPVRDPNDGTSPYTWHVDYVTLGGSPVATPGIDPGDLFDFTSDGVDDVIGIGYGNLSDTLSTETLLPNFQVGALGQELIIAGLYSVNNLTPTTLSVQLDHDIQLYREIPGAGTDVQGIDALGNLINAPPLTINQVPEPTIGGAVVCGLVALRAAWRRYPNRLISPIPRY